MGQFARTHQVAKLELHLWHFHGVQHLGLLELVAAPSRGRRPNQWDLDLLDKAPSLLLRLLLLLPCHPSSSLRAS